MQHGNAPKGLMFHLTAGLNIPLLLFAVFLDSLHIVQSFSKKGYPFDNAVCESFFKYLKKEETNRRSYYSFLDLRLAVFSYIEGFYNTKRPHASLGFDPR